MLVPLMNATFILPVTRRSPALQRENPGRSSESHADLAVAGRLAFELGYAALLTLFCWAPSERARARWPTQTFSTQAFGSW